MNIFFWKKKNQNPYPRSFAKRLTWRIMLTLFIVMGIISAIIVCICWAITLTSVSGITDRQLEYKAKTVEQILTEVYVATVNTVPDIEDNLHRPDRMQGVMKRIVELNPHIRSCGISFRENYYPQKGRWFCPYAQRRDSDSIVILQTIGGLKQDYLNEAWFQEAMKAKEGYWSKPFFDGTDQKTPLVAYLVPIRDERDSTVAVLGVDLSLDYLADDISNEFFSFNSRKDGWSAEKNIYYFVSDSTGTYLVHPDKNRIVNQNYNDIAKLTANPSDDYLGQILMKHESGHLMTDGRGNDLVIDGEKVMVNFKSLEHTPWTMFMVLPTFFVDVIFYILGGLLLFFILIGLIVVFFAGRRGIKKSSEPLRQLALSANEVAKGNFDTHLPGIHSRDEIHQLRDSFENMQQSLTLYVNELRDTTAQKAAMESELKIAHDIQMSMLPKTFPPYPERDDIDIYGMLTPAKAVGGDLFDFYIRDEKLFFCIGDVSGKGIPASMFMAVTRSLFRNISAHVVLPEHIAYALNNALTEGNETNMFVTLFTGVLDLATGHLHYCNAGHNAPLLVGCDVEDSVPHADPQVRELPCLPNLPLGIMGEFQFEAQEVDLDPDTTIFLFTDGLNEAENAFHEQFGDERIMEVANRLLAQREHQPINITYEMFQAVHNFVNGAEQSDDLTMLAIQYTNKQ
jgi:sigma-B regulation protein RsbU (phosphoserine phosphatase)